MEQSYLTQGDYVPSFPPTDTHLQRFHKIMWCKNEVVVLQVVEGIPYFTAYKVESIPTGSVTLVREPVADQ